MKNHQINRIFPVQNGTGFNSLDKYFMKHVKIKRVNYLKNPRLFVKIEIFKLSRNFLQVLFFIAMGQR